MQKKRNKYKKNAISLKLQELRKALGLRQDEFASRVGIWTRTLASWESGEVEPTARRISSVLKIAYKISPDAVVYYFAEFTWFKDFSSKELLSTPEKALYKKEEQLTMLKLYQELLDSKNDVIELQKKLLEHQEKKAVGQKKKVS